MVITLRIKTLKPLFTGVIMIKQHTHTHTHARYQLFPPATPQVVLVLLASRVTKTEVSEGCLGTPCPQIRNAWKHIGVITRQQIISLKVSDYVFPVAPSTDFGRHIDNF